MMMDNNDAKIKIINEILAGYFASQRSDKVLLALGTIEAISSVADMEDVPIITPPRDAVVTCGECIYRDTALCPWKSDNGRSPNAFCSRGIRKE